MDFNQIAFIQQLPESGETPRRTRIGLTCSPQTFLVKENAKDIALRILANAISGSSQQSAIWQPWHGGDSGE